MIRGGGRRPAATALSLAALILSSACARRTGDASWYGPTFHGRTTANGERYNMLDLTAAHRTLPFGSYVRVTNLSNARSLVVRINDRGPFVGRRIIDLSYTAAKILGSPRAGVMKVTLKVLDPDTGARLHRRQTDLVKRKGVRTWTDQDFAELASAGRGG